MLMTLLSPAMMLLLLIVLFLISILNLLSRIFGHYPSYLIGIHVINTENGLHIHQRKYVIDLLHRMKITGAKPAPTPCISGAKLSKLSGDLLIDPTEYRSMVGAL